MPAIILPVLVIILLALALMAVLYVGSVVGLKVFRLLADGAGSRGSVAYSTKSALREARHYAKLIKTTAQQCPPGPVRDRLTRTVQPVDEWLINLRRLEQALSKLSAQRNLDREMRRTTHEINELRRQVVNANTAELLSLRALFNSKQNHLETLEKLYGFQQEAELKVRKIASDLGATHAEMLLITARGDFSENRFQRLDENLQENLSGLRDIMAAMDEINYSSAVS